MPGRRAQLFESRRPGPGRPAVAASPVTALLPAAAAGLLPSPPPVPARARPRRDAGARRRRRQSEVLAAGPQERRNRLSPKAIQAAAVEDLFKELPANGHAAYGTASVIHPDALEAGGQRLLNIDAAFSAPRSRRAPSPRVTNEMARIVSPALAAGNAYGRGSGLEVGLAIDRERPEPDHPGQRGRGEGAAVHPAGDHPGRPGQRRPRSSAPACCGARPRARPTPPAPPAPTCPTGSATPPTSVSSMSATRPAAGRPHRHGPDRAVSQSRSHTFLVPQDGRRRHRSGSSAWPARPARRSPRSPSSRARRPSSPSSSPASGFCGPSPTARGQGLLRPRQRQSRNPVLQVLDGGTRASRRSHVQALLGPKGLDITMPDVAQITIGEDAPGRSAARTASRLRRRPWPPAAVDVVPGPAARR